MNIIGSDLVWDDEGEGPLDECDDETETWNPLDAVLGRLAKQTSNAGGKLTLELNVKCMGFDQIEFAHLLSQFLEYGELDTHHTYVYMNLLGVSPHHCSTSRPTRAPDFPVTGSQVSLGIPAKISSVTNSEPDKRSCPVGVFLARGALRKAFVSRNACFHVLHIEI